MKPPVPALSLLFSILAVGASSVAACSSSSTPASCNQNPFSCPTGETCWIGTGPDNFTCLSSGRGGVGEPCTPLQGSPGCSDRLVCLPSGVCAAFCDPENGTHGCAPGEACHSVTFSGGTLAFNACVPTGSDAGADAGSLPPPPSEAGTGPGNDSGNPASDAAGVDASNDASPCGPLNTPTNCGSCGTACDSTHSQGASCPGGKCTYSGCGTGWGDCDGDTGDVNSNGCETNTSSSAANCGTCGRSCSLSGASAAACNASACAPACKAGFANCRTPSAPSADDGCECATPGCCSTGCAVTHQDCVNPGCGQGAAALGQSYWLETNYCQPKGTPGIDSTYSQSMAAAAAAAAPSGSCSSPPCSGTMTCPPFALTLTPNAYYRDTTGSGGPCYVWVFATGSILGFTSPAGYLSVDSGGCSCPIEPFASATWN